MTSEKRQFFRLALPNHNFQAIENHHRQLEWRKTRLAAWQHSDGTSIGL
ncbi:MAG: hypothetical protein PUD30_06400 [Muribaculaceae bacterium]|nr:hypothetical protein [Muribaculaceae bacterium]